MTQEEQSSSGLGAAFYKAGCSCLGMVGCLITVIILIALTFAGGTLVLFTAPPLEFMSQFNNFLENYLEVTIILALVLALVIGGGGGYLGGNFIARWQSDQSD